MKIIFHEHALQRMRERGATREEVQDTIRFGEKYKAKYNRVGFRMNFDYKKKWYKRFYNIKQVEVLAVKENNNWIVVTIIVKYF